MVTIKAGFSRKANERLEEIARAGCPVDFEDPRFRDYFYCVNDSYGFTESIGGLLSFMFMGNEAETERKGIDYSYLSTHKGYCPVSRVDVSLKTPESLGRKLKLKEKVDPKYNIEDVGRVRLVVRDDLGAVVVFYNLKRNLESLKNKGYWVGNEKDHLTKPDKSGYRALHLKVSYGEHSNKVCEIQVVPKDVYDKMPELHAQYRTEQQRQLAEA